MDINDERIMAAVNATKIIRLPKQSLATFGTTSIYYYLITEPVYSGFAGSKNETVIREGRVIAEKPKIVTPYYLTHLEGFGAGAKRYLEMLTETIGAYTPGLLYCYRNEPKELNIVSERPIVVIDKLNADLDRKGDPLVSIIRAEDELWDVSLMKFIYEITRNSIGSNVREMGERGLFNIDAAGVPAEARMQIDELFARVGRGNADPAGLKIEIDRWGLWDEYQDRFLAMFRRR
jgi:hypothetical protein